MKFSEDNNIVLDYEQLIAENKDLQDSGRIGKWEWNLSTNRILLDERMEEMLGLERNFFDRTYEEFIRCINDEDVPHFQWAVKKAINEYVPFQMTFSVKANNKMINTKGIVEIDEFGNPLEIIGVCYCITTMKDGTKKSSFKAKQAIV